MPKGVPEPPCEFIAGLTLNYGWSNIEKAMVIKMIKNGATISDVIKEFDRNPIEVMILLDDLDKKKLIKPTKATIRRYK